MKIASYGMPVIIISIVLFGLLGISAYLTKMMIFKVLTLLIGVFSLFNFYFFRDPERIIYPDPLKIYSPADGKVVQIVEEEEPHLFGGKAKRISIFLSVFNVHVNRNPVSGKVAYFEYRKGNFLAAFKPSASDVNEQTLIGIESEKGKVLFKQIAGIIARRIRWTVQEGDSVEQGARMGMIMYGSRVDVFMPLNSKISVQIGDVVKGGLTILGEFDG